MTRVNILKINRLKIDICIQSYTIVRQMFTMYDKCIQLLARFNMKKVIEGKDFVTSVRLPKDLYEQVELKSEEMGGIGVSETIRILLSSSIKNSPLDFLSPEKAKIELNNKIQCKILQNVITSYYLLKDQIERSEEGLKYIRISHDKGKKAMTKILGQSSNESGIIRRDS